VVTVNFIGLLFVAYLLGLAIYIKAKKTSLFFPWKLYFEGAAAAGIAYALLAQILTTNTDTAGSDARIVFGLFACACTVVSLERMMKALSAAT
jgi:bacteriorhodopsin